MLNRPTFLIALFAGLLCQSPFAIADQTMDECVRITPSARPSVSPPADTSLSRQLWCLNEMQTAITALEACEIEACPGGEPGCGTPDCETESASASSLFAWASTQAVSPQASASRASAARNSTSTA